VSLQVLPSCTGVGKSSLHDPYEPGWFDHVKRKHRYPGGWRKTSHPTEAENAATFALLEKQRPKLERGKPLTIAIHGQEYTGASITSTKGLES
jgi:hypothetical protein